MEKDSGQKRAKVGGEVGANGEWYEGGKFIATHDNPKTAPVKYEPTPEEIAARAERDAQRAERDAAFSAWIAPRLVQFADLLVYLEHPQADDFCTSLAQQVHAQGYLSPKQAHWACKLFFGRQTKKNLDAWCDLEYALTERFSLEN